MKRCDVFFSALGMSLAAATLHSPVRAQELTVTATTVGPVRFGMTTAEAAHALGRDVRFQGAQAEDDPCGYARWEGLSRSVRVMVVNDTVVRVMVTDSSPRTADGIGVGSTERQLRDLYGDQLEVHPHEYDEGFYFIVTPTAPADAAHRLIFETDGTTVTAYRAGLLPAVGWIEGCL